MHTILEYRAGKVNSSPSSLSSSRMNKLADSSMSSNRHDRLESVQLIRRASETLRQRQQQQQQQQHLYSNNGHNGHASMETKYINCISSFMDATYSNVIIAPSSHTQMDVVESNRRIQFSDAHAQQQPLMDDVSTNGDSIHLKPSRMPYSNERQLVPSIPSLDGLELRPPETINRSESFNGDATPTTTTKIINSGCHSSLAMTAIGDFDKGIRQKISDGVDVNRLSSLLEDAGCRDEEDDNVGFFLQENKDDSRKKDHRISTCSASASSTNSAPFNSFAGFRNYMLPERAICGATGTIRGMRNRVRAGIATFKPGNYNNLHQLEEGKVVVYTTSTGIVRETFQQCLRVKTILNTLMIGFEERDIFKCRAYKRELNERLYDGGRDDDVRIPQVFVEGYHLGNVNTIEQLNECGRLRKILRPYQRTSDNQVCHKCGGYLLLLCPACNGSKKSVKRNTFTNSLIPLRCTKCDECGLVPCDTCCYDQPN